MNGRRTKRGTVAVALGRNRLPVGELRFEVDGGRQFSMFRYAQSWLDRADAFPLSPDLPLGDQSFWHSGRGGSARSALPGAISDGAPDSWGRGILRRVRRHPPTELDFLLLASDATRQGALRFADEDGRLQCPGGSEGPHLGDLEALRHLSAEYERGADGEAPEVQALARAVGSLGGRRPKSDFDDGGVLAVAKFTSVRDTQPVERVEVATLNLARAAGLHSAQARIGLAHDERPVAVVRRFDRHGDERIPYLSARSFLGTDARAAFYTDIVERLSVHGFAPERQMAELYRRVLFTILVSNNDDHLKNHGFLHVGNGRWMLAPAFDINPKPERHRSLKTGISEEYGTAASIEAAVDASLYFEIGRDRAREMLRAMLGVIDREWAGRCRAEGLSADEIAAYRPAFEHGETARARRLVAKSIAAGARRHADVETDPCHHSAGSTPDQSLRGTSPQPEHEGR